MKESCQGATLDMYFTSENRDRVSNCRACSKDRHASGNPVGIEELRQRLKPREYVDPRFRKLPVSSDQIPWASDVALMGRRSQPAPREPAARCSPDSSERYAQASPLGPNDPAAPFAAAIEQFKSVRQRGLTVDGKASAAGRIVNNIAFDNRRTRRDDYLRGLRHSACRLHTSEAPGLHRHTPRIATLSRKVTSRY